MLIKYIFRKNFISYIHLISFQMTNRAPKVARLVPIDTPDNSSSDSESETEQEGKEIQVEFEARSPEEEDYHRIRRLLQQFFLRNQVVNVSKVAETILGRCDEPGMLVQ